MTEIILIRHGETDWNAEWRLQGHLDIGLNAEGLRQAEAAGAALANEAVDAIFASDLQRALATAQAVAAPRGMPVQIDAGLRERCFGAFEGMLYADIGSRYPEAHAAMLAREVDARYPDGERRAETLREFDQRSLDTLRRIVGGGQYRKVVIVSHGGVLDCLYRKAKQQDLGSARDFDVRNASINRFLWSDDALQLLHWGDVAHLGQTVLDEIDR